MHIRNSKRLIVCVHGLPQLKDVADEVLEETHNQDAVAVVRCIPRGSSSVIERASFTVLYPHYQTVKERACIDRATQPCTVELCSDRRRERIADH